MYASAMAPVALSWLLACSCTAAVKALPIKMDLPTTLAPGAIASMSSRGYAIVPNWLPAPLVHAIRQDACALELEGLARTAEIGNRKNGVGRYDKDVRHSSFCPLIPPPRPSAGSIDTRMLLYAAMHKLCDELNESLLTVENQLAPFQTELAYLFYPEGGYYKRHIDVQRKDGGWNRLGRSPEDGGSFTETAVRREISVLLYLNTQWQSEWGGQLRIFPARECDSREESDLDSMPVEGSLDVLPEGGTLVLLDSARVPHEVMPTRNPRQCVVGWFRTLRSKS